jgi:adenylate cyclase
VVRVVFDNDDIAVDAENGDRLLDLCDEADASIPFSCRDASCATCLIDVVSGAELLREPDISERRLLVRIRAKPGQRLACQVRIGDGEGDVRVVPADGV